MAKLRNTVYRTLLNLRSTTDIGVDFSEILNVHSTGSRFPALVCRSGWIYRAVKHEKLFWLHNTCWQMSSTNRYWGKLWKWEMKGPIQILNAHSMFIQLEVGSWFPTSVFRSGRIYKIVKHEVILAPQHMLANALNHENMAS